MWPFTNKNDTSYAEINTVKKFKDVKKVKDIKAVDDANIEIFLKLIKDKSVSNDYIFKFVNEHMIDCLDFYKKGKISSVASNPTDSYNSSYFSFGITNEEHLLQNIYASSDYFVINLGKINVLESDILIVSFLDIDNEEFNENDSTFIRITD